MVKLFSNFILSVKAARDTFRVSLALWERVGARETVMETPSRDGVTRRRWHLGSSTAADQVGSRLRRNDDVDAYADVIPAGSAGIQAPGMESKAFQLSFSALPDSRDFLIFGSRGRVAAAVIVGRREAAVKPSGRNPWRPPAGATRPRKDAKIKYTRYSHPEQCSTSFPTPVEPPHPTTPAP